MIIIALGSNLPLANQTAGTDVLRQAAVALEDRGITVIQKSRLYKSEPVPVSDQDWYVNAAIQIDTSLSPASLLALLHEIEADFGRERGERNAARELDLDIIDFDGLVRGDAAAPPLLPHPRMGARAFVLLPLQDLVADWCHPITGASLSTLIDSLDPNQRIEPLEEAW